MLVLTRKLKQQIQIGSNITVTVLRVQGNSVRIGIEAPEAVRVLRSELSLKDDEAGLVDETPESILPANKPLGMKRNFTLEPRNPGEPTTVKRTAPLAEAVWRRKAGLQTTRESDSLTRREPATFQATLIH